MLEEEKIKLGSEIHAAMRTEREKQAKMTPEELAAITDDGLCAAPVEEQKE